MMWPMLQLQHQAALGLQAMAASQIGVGVVRSPKVQSAAMRTSEQKAAPALRSPGTSAAPGALPLSIRVHLLKLLEVRLLRQNPQSKSVRPQHLKYFAGCWRSLLKKIRV